MLILSLVSYAWLGKSIEKVFDGFAYFSWVSRSIHGDGGSAWHGQLLRFLVQGI